MYTYTEHQVCRGKKTQNNTPKSRVKTIQIPSRNCRSAVTSPKAVPSPREREQDMQIQKPMTPSKSLHINIPPPPLTPAIDSPRVMYSDLSPTAAIFKSSSPPIHLKPIYPKYHQQLQIPSSLPTPLLLPTPFLMPTPLLLPTPVSLPAPTLQPPQTYKIRPVNYDQVFAHHDALDMLKSHITWNTNFYIPLTPQQHQYNLMASYRYFAR